MSDLTDYWLEPFSKWQPRILLHGIKVVPAACECHAGEFDPVIPHLGELCALAEQHKRAEK